MLTPSLDSVSWRDYLGSGSDPGDVGGVASGADVADLNKALRAGDDINNPGAAAGEGFPLRVESLDATLFTTTFQAKDIKFWKAIAKDAAYNTVEEYNRLEAYGSGDSVFMSEGDLAEEDDSTYSRNYTKIKFLGTTRRVTHVMSVIRTAHGDAVARETVNGTLHVLRQLERALFTGDERLVGIQFDGLEKLLVNAWGSTELDDGQLSGWEDDVNVIDLRGGYLTEDHITDMTERLIAEPNYGSPSDLWMDTGITKDLSKVMYPKERAKLGEKGRGGIAIEGILTPFGNIDFQPSIMIPRSIVPVDDGVGRATSRPGAPTVGTATSPVYSGANTTYWAAGDAGAYFYKVCACSRYGKSTPVATAAVTVSAGDQVSIPVTDNGPNTSYYEVYRSDKGGAVGTCRLVLRIPRTGASQTLVDVNRFLPNCGKAYMLSQQADVLKWKQLAPFTKIPLAVIDSSVRWMQILYGALQVQKPLQNGIFINVGKLPTGAEA